MGDIAKGAAGVLVFFGVAFVITAVLLYWYSGSFMITSLALICAIVPVIWLLGLLPVFGLGLDPMSILVPFLIFSIAVSHAVQMTNAWKLETLHGADGITASTHSFQKLFIPGRDGVARECARLHGHRVRRDRDRARAGLHGDHRRHGDDHHQQDAAADPAVVLQVLARAGIETGRQGNRR